MHESAAVVKLTDSSLPEEDRRLALRSFARENGWLPSDEILNYRNTSSYAAGHLLVEHGLDNTAVITFLHRTTPFTTLGLNDQRSIISLSYNNLVDWHLFPDPLGILRVFNRSQPLKTEYIQLSQDPAALRAESFDRVVGRRPSPNVPALDDALIATVARWRRILASELDLAADTGPIAELFNAIFFVRALEDHETKNQRDAPPRLLAALHEDSTKTLRERIFDALNGMTNEQPPPGLIDGHALCAFDRLDRGTQIELLSDFYQNRFAPYAYDFSLMSKHALSRIYERYISILRPARVEQPSLFVTGDSVSESVRRDRGEVYTPQYIARFFSRFLKENTTPSRFRNLVVIDPACGSGIFLRTLLETQCDPLGTRDLEAVVEQAYANVHGIDVEENACKATRLSLTLLHLVLTGRFPTTLPKIESGNAIEYFQQRTDLRGSFDAIIANPPFVRWENIPADWQPMIRESLGDLATGRPDLYLAFLKIALDGLRPGGFLLFVVPHAFLLAESARGMRERIVNECWIHHLVDLSKVNVFEDTSSYPLLLVAERKCEGSSEPSAIITRCSGFAGHALEAALSGRKETTSFYTVYAAQQSAFESRTWRILSPEDYEILARLAHLAEIESIYKIGQGMNSGYDDVFVRQRCEVPDEELSVYAPLLRDRAMQRFAVPGSVDDVTFYPFKGNRLLDEAEMRASFPETWRYLEDNTRQLSERASVKRGQIPWWRPERPRTPEKLLRPKIVGPHLMLLPKFSLDQSGVYAVSRSPYIYHSGNDINLLKLVLAILNSSVGHWQIAMLSHRYSRGYARVKANTLHDFRIPQLGAISPRLVTAIIHHVDELLLNPGQFVVERQLDELVSDVYGIEIANLPETSTGDK